MHNKPSDIYRPMTAQEKPGRSKNEKTPAGAVHPGAYSVWMPLPPEGVVPVEPNDKALPGPMQTAMMHNPLISNAYNIARGKVYYEYYCIFCHGDAGLGDGPVGLSYMPKPADLRDPVIAEMNDGQLFRAMLSGPGHSPVLERVVPAGHRWYLVLYVRALEKNQGGQSVSAPLLSP